jgi:hypothetical protein
MYADPRAGNLFGDCWSHYLVSVATATRTIISDIGKHFSDVKVEQVTSEFCGTSLLGEMVAAQLVKK